MDKGKELSPNDELLELDELDLVPEDEFEELWQDGKYFTGKGFYAQNLKFLEELKIDSDAIAPHILENYDLHDTYSTAIEIGVPESWLRRKPQLLAVSPSTIDKNFKVLNALELSEDEIFTFMDKNLSERTDHELMSVLYQLAGIRTFTKDKNDKIELFSEKIFCEMPIPRAALRFKDLRAGGIELPIDIRSLFYFSSSMEKLDIFKKNGIAPPFRRGILVRPTFELRKRIDELDRLGVDLDGFKELLGFGERQYNIAKKLFETKEAGTYRSIKKLKFDLYQTIDCLNAGIKMSDIFPKEKDNAPNH